MNNQQVIDFVKTALSMDPACPHASELLHLIETGLLKVVDADWSSAGASCEELLDLYRFRLQQMGPEAENLASDVSFLCKNLSGALGERCHLATVSGDEKQYSLYMNKNRGRLFGCIETTR
jgi:hypothetical protein